MRSKTIGIPWYDRDHYLALIADFDDGEMLPRTYDLWFAEAKASWSKLEQTGARVVRVYLEPEDFFEWCRSNGRRTDAEGRQEFAAWFVSGKHPIKRKNRDEAKSDTPRSSVRR